MKYRRARFKRALLIKGWSQKTLAQKTGLSQPTISEFLRGHNNSPETAKVIADKLGLRMEEVVPNEGAA